MYGIRYHILTLVAVFLALGLGLLLGGTLGEQIIVKEQVQLLKRLEDRYTQTKSDNSALHQQADAWEQKAQRLEQVTAQMEGHYIKDRLIGQKVALVQLVPADTAPILSTLEQAGANVTATLQFADLKPLLTIGPTGQADKWGISPHAQPRARLQEITDRIVREAFSEGEAQTLAAMKQSNLVTLSGQIGTKPDHVLVIGGADSNSGSRMTLFDVPLLQAMAKQGIPTVAVETSQVARSGVTYYRDVGVSTVDNIDQATGQVAMIDVLCGATGHFGTKKSAEALLPHMPLAKEVQAR